ncbi:calcineurin-like phosphoesterase family protein [Humitalea rosea]|uniref:Calcineurin-like phosphoesterase family protein n=2 Tax=Humitalea rosea TaxID=990373 RepID=A0A2W7KK45_9PROT|nr:calcineurin-like phosphoesterase family protein [Humitalea rosea]
MEPQDTSQDGPTRRFLLECMTWAGTGVLWSVAAGLPQAAMLGSAEAAEAAFSFVQISDSHIGFDKVANPDPLATLHEAVEQIKALAQKPAFVLHTGDITHLSRPAEFDAAQQMIAEIGLPVFYVPGEHDVLDEGRGRAYLDRYGAGSRGAGWHSFEQHGVRYIGLVNVLDLKAGGLGNLGNEQLEWLENTVAGLSSSTPIVVFAHIPLWSVYPEWGWGTEDGARALTYLRRFGSVTVLNGHIHQIMQKVEGNVAFHTARSTAFPQPVPGTAPSPGPVRVAPGELRKLLGTTSVSFVPGRQPLAIVDTPLAG